MLDETYYFVKKLYYFRIFFISLPGIPRSTDNKREIQNMLPMIAIIYRTIPAFPGNLPRITALSQS